MEDTHVNEQKSIMFILTRDCDKCLEGNSHSSVAVCGERVLLHRLGRICLLEVVLFRLTTNVVISRSIERK